ncbi:hypothetical protein Dda_8651 [Drechslerella dactyloides]|uniref:Uncharacterized protein n=1 Tax=Drechslerella dactyloides TaxID=74499 RepID=A0AAD6IQT1_DREDA|nr:hypothetical protein Dda_8651 [Drechslerella dactyloides]
MAGFFGVSGVSGANACSFGRQTTNSTLLRDGRQPDKRNKRTTPQHARRTTHPEGAEAEKTTSIATGGRKLTGGMVLGQRVPANENSSYGCKEWLVRRRSCEL